MLREEAFSNRNLEMNDIRILHKDISNTELAGFFRTDDFDSCDVRWRDVPYYIRNFCDWHNRHCLMLDTNTLAFMAVYRMWLIKPFEDNNLELALTIMNKIFDACGYPEFRVSSRAKKREIMNELEVSMGSRDPWFFVEYMEKEYIMQQEQDYHNGK